MANTLGQWFNILCEMPKVHLYCLRILTVTILLSCDQKYQQIKVTFSAHLRCIESKVFSLQKFMKKIFWCTVCLMLVNFMAELICYEIFYICKMETYFSSIPLSHLLKYAKLPINQTDNWFHGLVRVKMAILTLYCKLMMKIF